MSGSRNAVPRVGPSRALAKADPDADISEVLASVPRFECQSCGTKRFGRSTHCGECGSGEIERVPGPGTEGDR
jgi:hypothetical protein